MAKMAICAAICLIEIVTYGKPAKIGNVPSSRTGTGSPSATLFQI
jgi:hypothetical protein